MNPTLFFSICSLLYCLLLIITLYSRKEINNTENKVLKILAIVNLGNLLCESAGIFLGKNYNSFKVLNDVTLRLMLVLYVIWFSFFVLFVLNVAKQKEKFSLKNNFIVYMIMIIVSVLVIILPINYITDNNGVIIYSSGMAVQMDYYYAMVCEIFSLLIAFKNYKKTKITNYASLFALIILSTLAAAIQSYYPSLLLTASSETFVLYIAYINIKNREKSKMLGEK